MFRLTKDEQKIIAFVLSVLLIGCAVRHWRAAHQPVAAKNVTAAPETEQTP